MPQTVKEFMQMAGPVLNYKLNGDPLKLESFIADVELVESLAEEPQKPLCLRLVKAKLEGKALECLPAEVTTVKDITDALQEQIKPESSKVVQGKIMALRLQKSDYAKFSKEAEELAEAFRRSLIVEGIPLFRTKISSKMASTIKTMVKTRIFNENSTVTVQITTDNNEILM